MLSAFLLGKKNLTFLLFMCLLFHSVYTEAFLSFNWQLVQWISKDPLSSSPDCVDCVNILWTIQLIPLDAKLDCSWYLVCITNASENNHVSYCGGEFSVKMTRGVIGGQKAIACVALSDITKVSFMKITAFHTLTNNTEKFLFVLTVRVCCYTYEFCCPKLLDDFFFYLLWLCLESTGEALRWILGCGSGLVLVYEVLM